VTAPSLVATVSSLDRRRADRDDTPAVGAGSGDRGGRRCGDLVSLGWNLVSAKTPCARKEGGWSDDEL
jgi:hypothetical protein